MHHTPASSLQVVANETTQSSNIWQSRIRCNKWNCNTHLYMHTCKHVHNVRQPACTLCNNCVFWTPCTNAGLCWRTSRKRTNLLSVSTCYLSTTINSACYIIHVFQQSYIWPKHQNNKKTYIIMSTSCDRLNLIPIVGTPLPESTPKKNEMSWATAADLMNLLPLMFVTRTCQIARLSIPVVGCSQIPHKESECPELQPQTSWISSHWWSVTGMCI